MHWSCLTADQSFMPSLGGLPVGKPPWTHDTASFQRAWWWEFIIRYGNSRNCPTLAGATHDAFPIICLDSLTRLALPVNLITRECAHLLVLSNHVYLLWWKLTSQRAGLDLYIYCPTHHLWSCSTIHCPPCASCWRLQLSLLIIVTRLSLRLRLPGATMHGLASSTKLLSWPMMTMVCFLVHWSPYPCLPIFWFNSLTAGKFELNFREVIFMLILIIDGGITYETALRWLPLNLNNDKSTLVQVMAWCRQATSHYLNQCWPRSLPSISHNELSHCGLVTPYGDIYLGQH